MQELLNPGNTIASAAVAELKEGSRVVGMEEIASASFLLWLQRD